MIEWEIYVYNSQNPKHKKSLEALNRTMKDLRNNHNRFYGAIILLAGDFRQTFPVIAWSTPLDEHIAYLSFHTTKSVGVVSIYILIHTYNVCEGYMI